LLRQVRIAVRHATAPTAIGNRTGEADGGHREPAAPPLGRVARLVELGGAGQSLQVFRADYAIWKELGYPD
jgi:hypothetical protein